MRGYIALILLSSLLIFGCTGGGSPPANNSSGCACTLEYKPVCGSDGKTYGNECAARCANVTFSAGACQNCTDSDGGKDTSVKGTASAAGINFTDSCTGIDSVTEYFCTDGRVDKETIKCADGLECLDGACVKINLTNTSCQDTDSGQNVFVQGTVTADGKTYTDSCTPQKMLREYFCQGNGMMMNESPCPGGYRCDSGRCVRSNSNCVETDNGRDIYHEGVLYENVSLVQLEFIDKCLDDYTLREYYCVGSDYNSEDVRCPDGYKCLNAACAVVR